MFGGTLFAQLILLWSSSRSVTRGSTVVPAYLPPLHPPLLTSPVSPPYAKILVPPIQDLSPAVNFLYLCRIGQKCYRQGCVLFHCQSAGDLERPDATKANQIMKQRDQYQENHVDTLGVSLSLTCTMESRS